MIGIFLQLIGDPILKLSQSQNRNSPCCVIKDKIKSASNFEEGNLIIKFISNPINRRQDKDITETLKKKTTLHHTCWENIIKCNQH